MRKALFTLNVGNYAPRIRELTYPLFRYFCRRRGYEFVEMTADEFPEWPKVYQKLQIYRIAHEMGVDFAWFLDADTLLHPDCPDFQPLLPPHTVANNGHDFGAFRWRNDQYFERDGRYIGTCGWNTMAPASCFDVWRPCDDLTLEQVMDNMQPLVCEHNPAPNPKLPRECQAIISTGHLADDYVVSRNIARFGLKYTTLADIVKERCPGAQLFWHEYQISEEEKVNRMLHVILDPRTWNIPPQLMGWNMEEYARHRRQLEAYHEELMRRDAMAVAQPELQQRGFVPAQ